MHRERSLSLKNENNHSFKPPHEGSFFVVERGLGHFSRFCYFFSLSFYCFLYIYVRFLFRFSSPFPLPFLTYFGPYHFSPLWWSSLFPFLCPGGCAAYTVPLLCIPPPSLVGEGKGDKRVLFAFALAAYC